MNYKLAKTLKKAGYPQEEADFCFQRGEYCDLSEYEHNENCDDWDCKVVVSKCLATPILEDLIEACGDDFLCLNKVKTVWNASDTSIHMEEGKTATEAVSRLWILLNK